MIVYVMTNKMNGKMYVGLTTVSVSWRWKEHVRSLKKSRLALHHAMRKYGIESFEISVLEELPLGSTLDDLDAAETKWIAELQTFMYEHPDKGYNMTKGSQKGGWFAKGRKRSQETRDRMSRAKRGKKHTKEHNDAIGRASRRYYETHSGPNIGKTWSEETRKEQVRKRHLRKKPVFAYDKDGLCAFVC